MPGNLPRTNDGPVQKNSQSLMIKSEAAIDIVYLWVNGNDAAWRQKRQYARDQLTPVQRENLARYSDVEGRYRDNDELRYSLRALAQFFPAHGHVYIITDAQVPPWLRLSEGITVIDHRDLIPHAQLPTFDSGHIESYIHRIPGLSERYFYFNDDVFFGSPVNVADWFWEGGIYVAWSDEPLVSDEAMRPDATALENACRLSNQWFTSFCNAAHPQRESAPNLGGGYQHIFRTFAHSPRPMLKSMLFELERVAPELFEGVRSTVFRTWNTPTIVSDFVMRWALATGRAQVRAHRHWYISSGAVNNQSQFGLLASMLGRIDFFCINDTTDDADPEDPRLENMRDALASMLPLASRFESGCFSV
jgi:hypothetical protein